MKALILLVTILSLWFDLSNGKPTEEILRSPSQLVMESIPLSDRPHFVTYHLSKALTERQRNDVTFLPRLESIPSEKREEFGKISTPPNFSGNLLDWTELELVPFKNGHSTHSFDAVIHGNGNYVYMQVCFPSGCVDPNDAGSLCCPF